MWVLIALRYIYENWDKPACHVLYDAYQMPFSNLDEVIHYHWRLLLNTHTFPFIKIPWIKTTLLWHQSTKVLSETLYFCLLTIDAARELPPPPLSSISVTFWQIETPRDTSLAMYRLRETRVGKKT